MDTTLLTYIVRTDMVGASVGNSVLTSATTALADGLAC